MGVSYGRGGVQHWSVRVGGLVVFFLKYYFFKAHIIFFKSKKYMFFIKKCGSFLKKNNHTSHPNTLRGITR